MAFSRTVTFAYLSPGDVRMEFMDSVLRVLRYHAERKENPVLSMISLNCSGRLAEGRSQIVDAFALDIETEWLWMVDADMTFEEDALEQLLDTAEGYQARIVGGLCFAGRADLPMFPTIYRLVERDGRVLPSVVSDYPRNEVIKVGATGAAFLLVHKSVFAEMQQAFKTLPNGEENPYPWFVEAGGSGQPFGEDIAFCLKANALDIPVLVNTGIQVGHVKTRILNEQGWDAQCEMAAKVAQKRKQALTLPKIMT